MIVDVYITLHPKFPGRAFVAAWPPSSEALTTLRAEGGTVTHARVSVPDPAPLPIVEATACELKYLHRSVLNRYTRHCGQVSRETETEVVVKWQDDSIGTFGRTAFEARLADASIIMEDEHGG